MFRDHHILRVYELYAVHPFSAYHFLSRVERNNVLPLVITAPLECGYYPQSYVPKTYHMSIFVFRRKSQKTIFVQALSEA